MKRLLTLTAIVALGGVPAACAAIAGLTDVPNPVDGGANDASSPSDSGTGGGPDSGTRDSGSGPGADSGSPGGPDSGGDSGRPGGPDATTDSGVVAAQSCQGAGAGVATCGPSGDSCCTCFTVTGTTYDFMYDAVDGAVSNAGNPATVTTFCLDEYEVTVGRFRNFMNAVDAGWMPPAGSGKHSYLDGGGLANAGGAGYEMGWNPNDDSNVELGKISSCGAASTWTASPGANEALPINCVDWYEAYAFCIWDGAFLPSEAEWELAAAGGTQQLEYPWGATDPGTGSQYAIYDCDYGSTGSNCSTSDTQPMSTSNIAPVGTAINGRGAFHQFDLAGNVEEWAFDDYAPCYVACTDCAYLPTDGIHVLRGGSFQAPLSYLSPTNRRNDTGVYHHWSVGFRCARSP